MSNPLDTSCPNCGEVGLALSNCKRCGDFIGITVMLAGKESEVCQHECGQRFQMYDSDGCGFYMWRCDSCGYEEVDDLS